jgi:hypothetical protein
VQEPYSRALATIPTGVDRVYQCHVLCWGKSNDSATRLAPAYVLINRRGLGQLASRGRLIARPAAAEADYRGIRPLRRCPRFGRIQGGVGCSRFTTTGNVLKHRQGHQHAGLRRPGAATRFRLLRARHICVRGDVAQECEWCRSDGVVCHSPRHSGRVGLKARGRPGARYNPASAMMTKFPASTRFRA